MTNTAPEIPTPRDLRNPAANLRRDVVAVGRDAVAACGLDPDVYEAELRRVPVLDVPMRDDARDRRRDEGVRPGRDPFAVRLVAGPSSAQPRRIDGITHWHVTDNGALNLYGPLPDGRVTKLRTFSELDWSEIERETTGGVR